MCIPQPVGEWLLEVAGVLPWLHAVCMEKADFQTLLTNPTEQELNLEKCKA